MLCCSHAGAPIALIGCKTLSMQRVEHTWFMSKKPSGKDRTLDYNALHTQFKLQVVTRTNWMENTFHVQLSKKSVGTDHTLDYNALHTQFALHVVTRTICMRDMFRETRGTHLLYESINQSGRPYVSLQCFTQVLYIGRIHISHLSVARFHATCGTHLI